MDLLDEDGQYVLEVPFKEHPEPLCLVLSFSRHLKVTVAEMGEGGRVWVRDEIEIYHEMERTRELKELLRDPGKHCKLAISIEAGDDAASSSMRFNIKLLMDKGKKPLVKEQLLELSPRPVQELAGALLASAAVEKHRAEKRLAIANENEKLRKQHGDWTQLVDEAINKKEEWQNEMMDKFVRLLNTKKDRIRDLQEQLGQVEKDSQDTEGEGEGSGDEMDMATSNSDADSEREDKTRKRRKAEKGRAATAVRAGRATAAKVKKEEGRGEKKATARWGRGGGGKATAMASLFDQPDVVYMNASDLEEEAPASGPSRSSARTKRPTMQDEDDSSTDDGGLVGSAAPAQPVAPPTEALGASQTKTVTGKSPEYGGFLADSDQDDW